MALFKIVQSDSDKQLTAELLALVPETREAMKAARAANDAIRTSHLNSRSHTHVAAQAFFEAEIRRVGLAAVLADKENLSSAAWAIAIALIAKTPA